MAISPTSIAKLSAGLAAPAELDTRITDALVSKNPGVKKIEAEIQRDETKVSALGQLQSALANLQAVAQSLTGNGIDTGAKSSAPKVAQAFTSPNAKPGKIEVEVQQLAAKQTLQSRAVSRPEQPVSSGGDVVVKVETGTVAGNNFTPKGEAKAIKIERANTTIEGIANALKESGVQAKVVETNRGKALEIQSESGSASSLRISVAGDAAVSKLLTFNPSGQQGLTEVTRAQDARAVINGKQVSSNENVITKEVPGVAIALTGKGQASVVVSQEAAQIEKNVKLFVDSYNAVAKRIDELKQGSLKNDAAVQLAKEQLESVVGTGGKNSLAEVGINSKNNLLTLDSQALKKSLAADPNAVAKLFTSSGKGVSDRLAERIQNLLDKNGVISKEKAQADKNIEKLEAKKDALTSALSAQAKQLVQQYSYSSTDALPGLTGGKTSLFDFFA
jgi:flagellar hook-associated protein 2